MDYSRLIQDAWAMMWRHRFLWVIGLFAGSGGGSCSSGFNFNFPPQWQTGGTRGREGEFPSAPIDAFSGWAADNLALIIAAVVALILLGLLLLVVSFIAQGGMAQATADLARGRPSSLRSAVRAGLHLFWRYVGLSLLLFALALVLVLIAAMFVGLGAIIFSQAGDVVRIGLIVVGVFFALGAVLVAIPVSILLGIVVAYAQRAIAVEDVGPIAALRSGVNLLRAYLGRSILIWLINMGLRIAVGILQLLVALVLFIPLGALGFALYAVAGFSVLTFAYAVFAALLGFAVLWGMSAISNTYFWSYWTIAYLRLSGQEEPVT